MLLSFLISYYHHRLVIEIMCVPRAVFILLLMVLSVYSEEPLIICKPKTVCNCNISLIACNHVVWTMTENGQTIYEPLRTANLYAKDYRPEIVQLKNNDIFILDKGKILPGLEEYMKELDFSYNRISIISPGAFEKMTSLEVLRLSHNKLSNLTSLIVAGGLTWNLRELYLDNNMFTQISADLFKNMNNLEKIVLDGNKNLSLTKKLFGINMAKLKSLSLQNCNILGLENDLFDELINLEYLSLRGNPFTEVPRALQNIPSLQHLDLSSTDITEIQSKAFEFDKKLEILELNNCYYLYIIHQCAFCGLSALKELRLNNASELYIIQENAFWENNMEEAPKLQILHLESANLSYIPDTLVDFSNIKELRIGGNPWNCNCELSWLLDESLDLTQGYMVPRCQLPTKLEDKRLLDLGYNELCHSKKRRTRLVISFCLLTIASIIGAAVYFAFSTYSIANIFYRPTMPNVAYTNLKCEEEETENDEIEKSLINV